MIRAVVRIRDVLPGTQLTDHIVSTRRKIRAHVLVPDIVYVWQGVAHAQLVQGTYGLLS